MSFDVFLQGFRSGESTPGDSEAVHEVIDPLVVAQGEGWVRIGTTDGEADVYGMDDPASGLMVNHISGAAAWEVVFQVALSARLAVIPVGCSTCVPAAEMAADLPPELAEGATVVTSGADILGVVRST